MAARFRWVNYYNLPRWRSNRSSHQTNWVHHKGISDMIYKNGTWRMDIEDIMGKSGIYSNPDITTYYISPYITNLIWYLGVWKRVACPSKLQFWWGKGWFASGVPRVPRVPCFQRTHVKSQGHRTPQPFRLGDSPRDKTLVPFWMFVSGMVWTWHGQKLGSFYHDLRPYPIPIYASWNWWKWRLDNAPYFDMPMIKQEDGE